MLYPTISEYIDAIRSAEDNFSELSNLRPVVGSDGNPVMSSGNFAVVFKMRDETDGRLYAVKCFLKEQQGRDESYRMIHDELEYVSSPYLTRVRYLERELFVDTQSSSETEFPVLQMDWVEGQTLDGYLRSHINDRNALAMLAYQFSRMGAWLLAQPFAHGDLKPDNIIVRTDGTLTLVDYDGMYVLAMERQHARELGSPDFRHPERSNDRFDEHIDDFSIAPILLSLKAIATDPSFLSRYGAADRLLLSEKDYRNISHSAFLREQFPSANAELNTVNALFLLALSKQDLSQVSFRLLNLAKPKRVVEKVLSTEVTDEDLAKAVKDEW